MPEVLIRCPVTRKQLATGIALDIESFHRADLHDMTVFCPFCQHPHEWQKEDAFLRRN